MFFASQARNLSNICPKQSWDFFFLWNMFIDLWHLHNIDRHYYNNIVEYNW